jgi:heptosyltransferase-3
VEKYGLQPIWTSSPDREEIALLHESAHLCKHQPVLVAGELSLNQMTCLLSRSSLYVGLDTAISHLAATTGVPMVALYGPTISAWWAPWNNAGPVAQQWTLPRGTQRNGNIMVIQKDWECVPCGRAGCDDSGMESRCMAGIEVGEVLDAVGLLLDKTPLLKGGGNAS